MSFFRWVGRNALALVAGMCAVTAWYGVLWLPVIFGLIDPSEDRDLPWRSLLAGVATGALGAVIQLVRVIAAKESRILSTLVISLILEGSALLVSLASTSLELRLLSGACAGVFTLFTCAHLFVFVFRRVGDRLGQVAPEGVPARLVALCSALTLAPFCAAPVAEDELASYAEPRATLDAADVDALAAALGSSLWKDAANDCLRAVSEYRDEGVTFAMRRRNLTREDAEDVVGGVMLSMCVPPKATTGSKRRYFFKSVALRANDPWRARERAETDAACPPRTPLAPEPDAALDEAWVRAKVSELPDDERRVLELRAFQGMTLEEAGQVLGFSKSKVDRLEARARELLASSVRGCPLTR